MSENKRQIVIDVPKGYEMCEPIDATHVWMDARTVCKLEGSAYEYKWVDDPLPPCQSKYINQFGTRVTAYLREIQKPEPFRVVLDTTIVPHTIVEGDNHGHPYESVKIYCVELPRGRAYREGMRVRVTLEEIREANRG